MANIWNSTSNTIVRGTSDADTIYNEGFTTVTIAAGAGNDSIRNVGTSTIRILGEAGDDSIYGGWGCHYLTLNGGDGDDTIAVNSGSNILLIGEAGDDSIYNAAGQQITISAGDGNDTVHTTGGNNNISIAPAQEMIQSATTAIALQSTQAQAMIPFTAIPVGMLQSRRVRATIP